jgi:hypothetical protein
MIARMQQHVVPITIGVSFFLFGFFVMVRTLGLTDREIVVGLVCGTVGGLTTLAAMLRADWKSGRFFPSSQ